MPPPFLNQIEQVRRRLVRRRALAGVCWVFAIVGGATMGLIAVDRLADMPAVRLAGTGCLVAMLLWAVHRYLVLGSRPAITSLDVALELERRAPRLTDTVSSAVQFALVTPEDPRAGSVELRKAVILHAAEGVKGVDWKQLARYRPLRQAVRVAALAASAFGLCAWTAPQMAKIGLVRLLSPLAAAEWPRTHHLKFIDPPTLLAAGSRFQLELVDRHGILPPSVQLRIRSRQGDHPGGLSYEGSWHEESVPMIRSGNRMIVHRMAGNRPFEFRARGGDDRRMPWNRVDVQPRPTIDAMRITVHPPDYTQLPPMRIDPPYRVLAGSRIEIAGQTSESLSRLRLLHPPQVHPSRGNHEDQTTELATEGKSFHSNPRASHAWMALQSGPAWFEMTTLSGLVARSLRPLSLEVVPDSPPEITLHEPGGNRSVVADARVELRIAVRDDLALADVSLICQAGKFHEPGTDAKRWSAASPKIAPEASILDSRQIWSDPPDRGGRPKRTRQVELSTTLHLADWRLRPGQTILVDLVAADYRPLKPSWAAKRSGGEGPPKRQVGRMKRPLQLTIVSKDQLIYQEQTQQARLLFTLTRARDHQREVKTRARRWSGSAPDLQQFRGEADDTLRQQRQVARLLVDGTPRSWALRSGAPSSGAARGGAMLPQDVAGQIDTILRTMQTNQRTDRELERALGSIRASLVPLADSRLSEIEQQLSDWIKGYGKNQIRQPEPRQRQALNSITRNQQRVIDEMDRWLSELTRTGSLRQIANQLSRLSEDQLRLLETCRLEIAPKIWGARDELGQSQLGQSQSKASGHGRWIDAARAQRDLSNRFGEVLMAIRELASQQADGRPRIPSQSTSPPRDGGAAAERLARVLEDARKHHLQSELLAAADDLAEKRIGRSMTRQQQIADRLGQMADQLSGEDRAGQADEQAAASDSQPASRQGEPASAQSGTNSSGAGSQAGSGGSPADGQSSATGPLQADELRRMHALIHGLWGQLPERDRMEIMQPVGDTFLPRYAPEIEQYFRSMAEPRKSGVRS